MTWYGRRQGSKIADLIKEISGDAQTLLNLEEEVKLARVLAEKAVTLYEEAHFGETAKKVDDELRALAAVQLRGALDNVVTTVEKATKVRVLMTQSGGVVSPEDIRTLSSTLAANITAAAKRMGLTDEQIAELTKAIEESTVPDAPKQRLTVVVS